LLPNKSGKNEELYQKAWKPENFPVKQVEVKMEEEKQEEEKKE